ncbi:MAG TPA: LptF/LptG family permease [Chitinophagaceae bacterium]|nr:LptF/LptG family permease [Chitinophagaceae bacterium]
MIKKLDRLILKAFVGPFIATFFITLFVLVLQFFWLYIDDIVGKGLDFFTIARLMSYVTASVVPLALPLAVLLSSIMTFGNLGETFELVAIKSAGIPLLRFMRPLVITSLFICGIAFLFNNYIIPKATLKLNTLKYDIIVTKPALDIKEGVFYDKIDGYVIKIGKKEKDGTIRNVVIYEKNYNLQDNITVADSGYMRVSSDKRYLEFLLNSGWRYSEKGERVTTNTEFTRMGFKDYKKIFDLSSFKIQRTADSVFKDNWRMLSVRQLGTAIDSLEKTRASISKSVSSEVSVYLLFARNLDSNWQPVTAPRVADFNKLVPDSLKMAVLDAATAQAGSVRAIMERYAAEFTARKTNLRLHLIEWHRKFSLSFACMVLFLIGAPLGSIIRKGGIGTPLIFAVIFFVVFFLLNNYGEKFVKQDVLQPLVGMWLATFVLLPVGFFLVFKAMRDSQLFNQEFYYRFFRKLRTMVRNRKWKGNPSGIA